VKLHLIDGTFELFRAHYSKRPDHPAKATIGVVSSILALFEEEGATHLAVAFDNPIESFRNDLYAGYKTGDGMDPDLVRQMDPVEKAVAALGVTVWSMRDHEADDALATGAARWAKDVEQVRIMTPDKDLGQCLRGKHVVQFDRIRRREIDEDALRAMRGVGPESIPDWLALIGDTADGFPGLPGFGEKTASALLARWTHLEAIPDDPAQWTGVRGADKLAATLRERRDEAKLYKKLATLVTDVPLAEKLDDLRWRGAPRKDFLAWCDEVGTNSLQERVRSWR
jgi:5'-3' exonuclease